MDRIVAIDWRAAEHDVEHGASRARLMREYLRRAALWVREFQKSDPHPVFGVGRPENWPFFDIARRVDPRVRAEAALAARLDTFLAEHASGFLVGAASRAALHWASLPSESLGRFPPLPDPFEPLVLLLERGGGFCIENGFIDFVAHRVRLTSWQDHVATPPIPSLSPVALDALDRD
ncbi:hypothetical protein [Streptomyces cirratus]|uniref:hypothetical protein n=1 Tax=Streptomyces cirratus TaxID=68187 RepID=UPI00167CB17D|nr:hypothetical protein [Streptomyces cirratus]